jgi:DNA polymerase V
MKHGGARPGAGRPRQYDEKTKPIRLPINLIGAVQQFIANKGFKLPLYDSKVSAGSPAISEEESLELVDLNQHLIKHPQATFLVRVNGASMMNAGIHENDLLVVDRELPPVPGKIVVVAIDGQLTVKRLHIEANQLCLLPENPDFAPILVSTESHVQIWGVVTNVIHAV